MRFNIIFQSPPRGDVTLPWPRLLSETRRGRVAILANQRGRLPGCETAAWSPAAPRVATATACRMVKGGQWGERAWGGVRSGTVRGVTLGGHGEWDCEGGELVAAGGVGPWGERDWGGVWDREGSEPGGHGEWDRDGSELGRRGRLGLWGERYWGGGTGTVRGAILSAAWRAGPWGGRHGERERVPAAVLRHRFSLVARRRPRSGSGAGGRPGWGPRWSGSSGWMRRCGR